MEARVDATRERVNVAPPRPLFSIRPRPPVRLDAYPYDMSRDGQRFVVNALTDEATSNSITLVLHWMGMLTRE